MRATLLLAFLCAVFTSCEKPSEKPDFGVITFELDDSTQVVLETGPLEFEKPITIKNSTENIVLRPVSENIFSVPVFGGSISGRWNSNHSSFMGVWTDSLRPGNYNVPVKIISAQKPLNQNCLDEESVYEWTTTEGRLVARVSCGLAKATFLTPTGDYRYLSGYINERTLKLVTFDGAHLFHITADIYGDSLINGVFKSGNHYVGKWGGIRSFETAENSEQQTPGFNPDFAFSGINEVGDTIVWNLQTLKESGKTGVVVDVLGTWCPNCLDEVKLLKELYKKNPDVDFVSMAFERKDLDHSLKRIKNYREELGVEWDILYGGKASKQVAKEAMPFIGEVTSFPTTVFISSKGYIKVHRGFNGPATGPLYDKEIKFFEDALEWL